MFQREGSNVTMSLFSLLNLILHTHTQKETRGYDKKREGYGEREREEVSSVQVLKSFIYHPFKPPFFSFYCLCSYLLLPPTSAPKLSAAAATNSNADKRFLCKSSHFSSQVVFSLFSLTPRVFFQQVLRGRELEIYLIGQDFQLCRETKITFDHTIRVNMYYFAGQVS